MHKNATGIQGEIKIREYLVNKGHKILNQNYQCPPFGEIDLVTLKESTLYFVEVKTRASDAFMDLTQTMDNRKLNAMERASEYYILKEGIPRNKYQFILALVTLNLERNEINFYKDLNITATL